MRRITAVSLLALALAVSAHAGEIPNDKTPPPPTTTQTTAEPKAGEIDNGSTATMTLIVLNLLHSLLSARN